MSDNQMNSEYSTETKDKMLREAFARLSGRIAASPWVTSPGPYSALRSECSGFLLDAVFVAGLRTYLGNHAAVRRAFQMFFTIIAMAARARWHDTPEPFRGVAARGWFLGRWIPTFLIIDGPVGRFVLGEDSPLANRLSEATASPMCASVRGFLSDRTFRLLRNGFAHWAFDWEVVGPDQYVVAYDYERDLPTAKLHLEEADAYHIIAFAVVEILNEVFIAAPSEMTPNKALEPSALM
jgi:hypothetical protein